MINLDHLKRFLGGRVGVWFWVSTFEMFTRYSSEDEAVVHVVCRSGERSGLGVIIDREE